MEEKKFNILGLFKKFRKDREEQLEKEPEVFSGLPQQTILFVDNQWIMYNYPLFTDSGVKDIFCIGIMKRWIDPKDSERQELLVIGTSDTGERYVCLLENLQSHYMLVIPENKNYTVTDYLVEPEDYEDFQVLVENLRKKADLHWKLYPSLKPQIIDTHGRVKPLVPEESEEELEMIRQQINQRKQTFQVKVLNTETHETEEINYVISRGFFKEF